LEELACLTVSNRALPKLYCPISVNITALKSQTTN